MAQRLIVAAVRLAGLSLLIAGFLGRPGVMAGEGPAAQGDARRPSFVVFVADDLGWRDVGYHESEIKTPNIDRLAQTGVRLERFYVCPTCSPTRAELLSGQNACVFGILSPIAGRSLEALPLGTVTLAGELKRMGYATAITGKWHLGLRPEVGPKRYGFDHTYGYFHGQIDPYTHRYKNGDMTWHRDDQFVDEEGHATDLLTREAIAFVEQHSREPFFLYVPFSVPHTPLNEPERWMKVNEDQITNASRRLYAASVSHMDDAIGQICGALVRLGLEGNTVVVFFSDNGGVQAWMDPANSYEGRYQPMDRLGDNRPLRGWKAQLYEGGIRVPALVNWLGHLEPRVLSEVTSVCDLMPTILGVAGRSAAKTGASMPVENLEGVDVWPALTGQASLPQRRMYWATPSDQAVCEQDWKLIRNRKTSHCELFNLAEDPYEQRDLASQQPERVQQLLKAMSCAR